MFEGKNIVAILSLFGIGAVWWFGTSLFSAGGGRRHYPQGQGMEEYGYYSQQEYWQLKQEVKEAGSYQAWLKKMAFERQQKRKENAEAQSKQSQEGLPHRQQKKDYSLSEYIFWALVASLLCMAINKGVIKFG